MVRALKGGDMRRGYPSQTTQDRCPGFGRNDENENLLKASVQSSVLAGYTVRDLFLFRLRMGVRASEQHKNRIEMQQTNNGHGGINEGIHLQKL